MLRWARRAGDHPALAYLRARALAAGPVLVVAVGHGAFRGLKDTRTPLTVAVAANMANAVLSYVLIYPAGLGVVGAAYGTLVAQNGAAAAFLLLARGRRGFGGSRPERLGIDPTGVRAIVRISRDRAAPAGFHGRRRGPERGGAVWWIVAALQPGRWNRLRARRRP